MSTEVNHNKIINQVARSVLKLLGLFQKGQSRIWIDDNGWFLTIVEFQPSNWDKGSYLNVAIHYLWEKKEYFSFDYGGRENEFVKFNNDEKKFYDDMTSLAEKAVLKVVEYRAFRDVAYAKEQILKKNATASGSVKLYNNMMICGMNKENMALKFYEQLIKEVKDSTFSYEIEYHRELTEEISKVINNKDEFYNYITNKINLQRKFWNAKSSMKKLKV